MNYVHDEVERFWRIIKLKPFRKTEGVSFDILPMQYLPKIDGVDRVVHKHGAISPGPVGEIERPWYFHPHQEDNLLVLQGLRMVEIYTLEHRRVERFTVEPEKVYHDDVLVYEGPAMLVWPTCVFHRIVSGKNGSVSLNFAVRNEGFNVDTNFSVYDLDTATGKFKVIREGKLDQFPG